MVEEPLPATEEDGHDVDGELVDESGAQVLLRRRGAAADRDVLAVRRGDGLLERALDAVGDEVEGRPALHLERRALVVGEDEHRCVERRVLAPPAPPLLVLPRAADRPEHVAPHDRRADVLARPRGMPVVEGRLSALQVVLLDASSVSRQIHSWSASPPLPSGSSMLWSAPATYPSSDM